MMGSSSISIHVRPQLARQQAMSFGHVSKPTGLRMGTGTARRRLHLVSSCCTAAGRPSEPSPDPDPHEEEDPRAAWYRKFRGDMDKYSREYAAALRALGVGTGTSQDAMVQELETTVFRDEDDKYETYLRKIPHEKGRGMAWRVCVRVAVAINLSSMVAANAHLRFNESSEMVLSPETVKQTIRTYVSTFLKTAEDACQMKFDRTNISLFLDALRGLAAISHILFEDALAAVNHIEDGSPNYIPEYDVERLNHELNSNMKELVKNFMTASESEVYKLLLPTMTSAENHISSFVYSMMNLRRDMVIHIEARNRQ